jgi:hypothetical protein
MKLPLLLVAPLLLSCAAPQAQTPGATTDKARYKYDEPVNVTFSLDARSDSSLLAPLSGWEVLEGPVKSSSISVINGRKQASETIRYSLRALTSGRHLITPPVYYLDGKKVQAKRIEIEIDPSSLSSAERNEHEVQAFIDEAIKPEGSVRIVYHGDKGYVEVYGALGWQFQRRLSMEEIETLRKLK